tara:strand:+ start:416 stop:721 length:306 start_codon:yes stop_codon:yes gene_type:complete
LNTDTVDGTFVASFGICVGLSPFLICRKELGFEYEQFVVEFASFSLIKRYAESDLDPLLCGVIKFGVLPLPAKENNDLVEDLTGDKNPFCLEVKTVMSLKD